MPTPPEHSFIPLSPTASPASRMQSDFQIAVASGSAQAQPFHTLGQQSSAGAKNHEPRVTLRRENNQVSAIVVECSCGQTIELTCVYEPPAPVASSPPPPMPVAAPPTSPTPPVASPAPPLAPVTEKSKEKPPRKSKR